MTRHHVYPLAAAPVTRIANQLGGLGEIAKHAMIAAPLADSLFAGMSVMTIPAGSSVGVHVHPHNEEAYIVIAGCGVYTSEEGEHPVGPGDIALCFRGEKHGIANTGSGDMLVAGIVVQVRGE